MSKIFTRTFRVRWSEQDVTGQVSPANFLRYLVETAYDWGDALGLSSTNDNNLGLFWLIRETDLRILHPLKHNDVVDFTIWMVNWQRVRGTRCFEIKLKDSDIIIAQGTQHIVSMDRVTERPITPPLEIIDHFRLDEPRIFPFERFPKIFAPETSFKQQRQVEWQDLDAQKHVNNAIYVTYAEEIAMQELTQLGWDIERLTAANLTIACSGVHIQYLSPAIWGETLTVATHTLQLQKDGGSRYVSINRSDGSSVAECILEWELTDMATGNNADLPKELVNLLQFNSSN